MSIVSNHLLTSLPVLFSHSPTFYILSLFSLPPVLFPACVSFYHQTSPAFKPQLSSNQVSDCVTYEAWNQNV